MDCSLVPTRATSPTRSRGSPRTTRQRGFLFCEAARSVDLVPQPAQPGATASGGASANMAPRALTVFVSRLASTYTQQDNYRRLHLCRNPAGTLPAWENGDPARPRSDSFPSASSGLGRPWSPPSPPSPPRRAPGKTRSGGRSVARGRRRGGLSMRIGPGRLSAQKGSVRSLCSRRLRWGMQYRLTWLLHSGLPSTFRLVFGTRLSSPKRICR